MAVYVINYHSIGQMRVAMIIVLNGRDSLTNFSYGWVYNSHNYSNAIVVMDVSLKSPEHEMSSLQAGMCSFSVLYTVVCICS